MSESDEKQFFYAAASFKERVFQPYVTAIGRAAMAWNNLQEELGYLFWSLLGGGWPQTPLAMWQVLKVDRAKRDILGEAANHMAKDFYEAFPDAKNDIAWLLGEVNKLEDARNNVVHAPLQLLATIGDFKKNGPLTHGKQRREIPAGALVVPYDWLMNHRAKKIAGKNILTEYRWCHEAAIVLRDYAITINHALREPTAPWPKRPRLPNRGQTRKK